MRCRALRPGSGSALEGSSLDHQAAVDRKPVLTAVVGELHEGRRRDLHQSRPPLDPNAAGNTLVTSEATLRAELVLDTVRLAPHRPLVLARAGEDEQQGLPVEK